MALSYDCRKEASALSDLPASRHVDKLWNDLNDLDDALDSAAHDYDVAASYGGSGKRDAQAALTVIRDTQKKLRELTRSGQAFDKLFKVEGDFAKKHKSPEEYSAAQRAKIYPR